MFSAHQDHVLDKSVKVQQKTPKTRGLWSQWGMQMPGAAAPFGVSVANIRHHSNITSLPKTLQPGSVWN